MSTEDPARLQWYRGWGTGEKRGHGLGRSVKGSWAKKDEVGGTLRGRVRVEGRPSHLYGRGLWQRQGFSASKTGKYQQHQKPKEVEWKLEDKLFSTFHPVTLLYYDKPAPFVYTAYEAKVQRGKGPI